tara:strand:- start:4967 stop:5767 length:801 start_codon:yes stop_codon:yes gene_type:complete
MSKEQFFDIGVNLTHPSFVKDLDKVIEEAIELGVNRMCVTGSDLEESISAYQLAFTLSEILISTAGIHPHQAKEFSQNYFSEIKDLLKKDNVKAIGETGLDFYRNFSTEEQQKKSFEMHIETSIELQKPLFLHVRNAHNTFMEMLEPVKEKLPKTVVHCFTGTQEELMDYIEMDFYIGITGWICDERRGAHLKDLINLIPLEKLMIETDAPYLTPRVSQLKNSQRNEPKFLPYVVEEVALNRNETKELLISSMYLNSLRFFDLDGD